MVDAGVLVACWWVRVVVYEEDAAEKLYIIYLTLSMASVPSLVSSRR